MIGGPTGSTPGGRGSEVIGKWSSAARTPVLDFAPFLHRSLQIIRRTDRPQGPLPSLLEAPSKSSTAVVEQRPGSRESNPRHADFQSVGGRFLQLC